MVSFMDLFAGRFGDERRAKRVSSGRATCGTAKPDRAPSGARPGRHGGVREVLCQPVCDTGRDFRGGRIGVSRAALKYGTVKICRPRHCSTDGLPKSMTLQLVEGRTAGPEHRANEVIAPHELDFAVALNSTLESKTDKQKNPHQEASLAWFVDRLGDWSGYQRYGPAAVKPSIRMESIQTMSQEWNLRQNT